MNAVAARIRPMIGTKDFYKRALTLMIPVVIQQLINTLFNVVDNVMVGSIGASAISAVTASNKPYMIFFGVLFGMCGAAGILISQYYGAGEKDTCQGLFAMQVLLGLGASLLFAGAMLLFPRPILSIFLQDGETVHLGVEYMQVVCLSYLPVSVSSVCMFSMRALGQNKMPMLVSLLAMLCNAALNALFIYGMGMGVTGAALGTLVSRTLEMLFYMTVLLRRKAFFSLALRPAFRLKGPVIQSFARRAVPLTLNEILFQLGFSIYFWTYARINEAAIPAVTIAEQAMQIGVVVSVGMASAVSVFVGTELGAGRLDSAWDNAKKLLLLVCMIGMVCTCVGFAAAFVLPLAFKVSDELRALAKVMTLLYCFFYIPNAVYACCFYCFRAGGDTKAATLLDSGYMYLAPVPVSLLMGLFGPGRIDLTTALLVTLVLTNAKVIPALIVLKKKKWVQNITL